jgi:hypothetical protein
MFYWQCKMLSQTDAKYFSKHSMNMNTVDRSSFLYFLSNKTMSQNTINMILLKDEFTLYQFPKTTKVPASVFEQEWFTVSKTTDELSIILPSAVPMEGATKTDANWKCFKVDAQMEFELVGILVRIVKPLKDNNISVFAVSTYDTDYVLVKSDHADRAFEILGAEQNMTVRHGGSVLQ